MKCMAIEWEKTPHNFLKKKKAIIYFPWYIPRVQQKLKDLSIHIKSLPFDYGSSQVQVQQRVKHFKFCSQAKLFLKFSWQPAPLVIRRFDVCFKNLAHTDKL